MDPAPQPQPIQNTSPSVSAPPTPQPTPDRSWIKWIVLIFFVAFIISAGSYLIIQSQQQTALPTEVSTTVSSYPTPTPDPTANWKTYSVLKPSFLEFSMQYPPDWRVEKDCNIGNYCIASPDQKGINEGVGGAYDMQSGILIGISHLGKEVKESYYYKQICNKEGALKGDGFNICSHTVFQNNPAVKLVSDFGRIGYKATIYNVTDKNIKIHILAIPNSSDQIIIDRILSTFKFLEKKTEIVSTDKISPDGSFKVTEDTLGDYTKITVEDKTGTVIVEDLISYNNTEIGYNVKFTCQCGTSFKGWVNNFMFTIKIVNGYGEEYEYLVDAKTGIVDEVSFKKIK